MREKLADPLSFLLDEGAPVGLRLPLAAAGHKVILHHQAIAAGSPDDLVCITAMINNAVLVAIDGDMKQFAKRYGVAPGNDGRFDKLHVLRICCDEVLALKRVEQAVSFIQHEWSFTAAKAARRLWVDIGPHFLRSHR